MREYLVRTSSGHELPENYRELAAVLLPEGLGCEQIDGWGSFRMRCAETEVSFSAEMVGWQVGIEGSMTDEDVERMIEMITRQVEAEARESCEWTQISW